MPKKIFTFKIGGEAGAGQQLMGLVLSKYFTKKGLNIFTVSEYPSRIRGGFSMIRASVSKKSISAAYKKTDFLTAFNEDSLKYCVGDISKGAGILYDSSKFSPNKNFFSSVKNSKIYALPVESILKEISLKPIHANFVVLGALSFLLSLDQKAVKKTATGVLRGKSKNIITGDMRAFDFGYEFAGSEFSIPAKILHEDFSRKSGIKNKKILATANEMASLSAMVSGCTAYFAYPMSPATSILHYLAKWSQKNNILIKQSYDEIETIHLALGASFAGARVLTATSGGGFALMAEAISEAAMAEIPVVVINSQRPAPATGLPTWTEQGDLLFAANIGHGDFTRIVLAPGDAKETFFALSDAFNLAEKYQTPVIVLLDKYLSDGYFTFSVPDTKKIKINRGKLLSEKDIKKIGDYKRYKNEKDGVSRRSIPGQKNGIHIANTDEHDEYGYSIEGFDHEKRKEQMEKRQRKLFGILSDLPKPVLYGKKSAKNTIIGWGSVKGPILEAMNFLPEGKFNFLHFSAVTPLDKKYLRKILNGGSKYYLVENNISGQFGGLIEGVFKIKFAKKILKYDGSQFFPEEIISKLGGKINIKK